MDLQFLHMLQGLRESLPSPVETFFVYLSYLGEGPGLVAIVLIVYWCVDKRAGLFSIFSFGVAIFVNQILKNIACVYRPWIRDATIVPSAGALDGATGYSFPSGHTTATTSTLGAIAWRFRKGNKAVSIICIVVIILMCFSRNFLCVHTPQDVLVGLAIGIVSIVLMQFFFNWIERYDALVPGHNKDIIVMIVALVLCVIALAVIVLKPYPMDYVDGQLLVDPVEMQKGTFEAIGVLAGLSIAWVLERRFVSFSTEELDTKKRIVRFIVGVALVGIVFLAANTGFKMILPYNIAKLCTMFCAVFMGVFLAPLVFNKIEKRQ